MPKQTLFRRSLSARLLMIIALWTLLALVTTGILLSTFFRQNAERNFDDLLLAHAYNLIGAIELAPDGTVRGMPNLGDPRFLTPLSGWSWVVATADDPAQPLLFSASLAGDRIEVPDTAAIPFSDQFQRTYEIESAGTTTKRLEAQLFLGDGETLYQVMVSGSRDGIDEATAQFSHQVVLFFSLFGLGTIVATAVAIRFGLKPLDDAREQLNKVREGEQESLSGGYPKEIAPLIGEINALISSNRKVTERARLQVGNLAHALKTPLAVIKNEASRGEKTPSGLVSEQAQIMQNQIDAYLSRARISAQMGTIHAKCEAQPVAERLMRVMRKLAPTLKFEEDVQPALQLALEKQDFEEVLGNLLENASHYAKSKIRIQAKAMPPIKGERATALLQIDDDGPGVEPEQFANILQRGKRLDESLPGTGLGLSIVNDIVEEYGGSLELDRSELGGLKIAIILPAFKSKTLAS
ncbi:ATP-binding protein [Pseudahrensia aquimaris]|uniref:histidine kinase n=1 Tax=Pseudahrensia aquimaris TaxID=744461 RepID=A0ABW3FGE9_9HYPH